MSIWQKAYETYEYHAALVGIEEEGKQPLTPVGHIVQKAQIELTLRGDGTFFSAVPLDQKDCKTIIPATEASAARTQKPVPHPLCEQLGYMIPGSDRYGDYVRQLKDWADSFFSTPQVRAVLHYIQGGTILKDLQRENLVTLKEDGSLAAGKTAGADYEKCMIRWVVLGVGGAVWKDPRMFGAFQQFQQADKGEQGLCMISGERDKIALSHPKGTVANAYGAKLISANDNAGFTFRGRFLEPEQAAAIGYQASQKIHSALQWLCANQGVVLGGRTFLCWNPKGKNTFSVKKLPDLFDEVDGQVLPPPVTPSDYKRRLEKTLQGWKEDLPDEEDVVIAAFEAATTGRLSITHYSEMKASDFRTRLQRWYQTTALPDYRKEICSPALALIVKCAYGVEQNKWLAVDDRILREHLQRLLCCMTEEAAIPVSLVKALCDRASHPLCFKERNNRALVLFNACALLRKYLNDQAQKEEWTMILDRTQTDRSYLFGRMLAVYEYAERAVYGVDDREPNAIRMQSIFCRRPLDTAAILEQRLEPYLRKLHKNRPGLWGIYHRELGEIHQLLEQADWSQDLLNRPLEGTYLLGYYQQRNDLYTKKTDENTTEEE